MGRSRSAVRQLPAGIREELDRRLIAGAFTGYRSLVAWLHGAGFRIGLASVHRHGVALERRIERVRHASEQAQAFVAAVGDDGGALSDAAMRDIQMRIHDVLLEANEDRDDLKTLAQAARALADVARASASIRDERRKARREAAAAAGETARRSGVSADVVAAIRQAIEGTT